MVEETLGRVMSMNIGAIGGLHVVLEWRDDYGTEGPVGKTWGDLQLWVGNTIVWGQPDHSGKISGITWNWIDFLEFLGNAWPYLNEEEQYPIDFQAAHPALGELRGAAKLRWRGLTEEQADMEEDRLRDFLAVHDFSEALQGGCPPQMLLLREGKRMLAATDRYQWILSFDETMGMLGMLGEEICERIAKLTDQRSENARIRWSARNAMSAMKKIQLATGMDESWVRRVWPGSVDDVAANDDLYELKAAARMVSREVSDDQLKAILENVATLPKGNSSNLNEVREKANDALAEHENDRPADQGYALALMLREHIGKKTGRIEPEDILKTWGVSIKEFELKDSLIDAIAFWGAGHIPTILLNPLGPRTQKPTGKRSTLAHEICHLLADVDGALPAVEALGGNVPRSIEQRANAFAAEFLLPRAEAGRYVKKVLEYVNAPKEQCDTVERAITELAKTFGASHETTAWQIHNSGCISASDKKLHDILQKNFKSVHDPFEHNQPENLS